MKSEILVIFNRAELQFYVLLFIVLKCLVLRMSEESSQLFSKRMDSELFSFQWNGGNYKFNPDKRPPMGYASRDSSENFIMLTSRSNIPSPMLS